VFSIVDEGPTSSVAAPPVWRLVARDAFNGVLLWKRDLGPWEGHWRLFRSGPPDLPRRLVAVGDCVYATEGYGKAVVAYDAATGKTVRRYDPTEGASEILYDNGRLYVVVGTIDEREYAKASAIYYPAPALRNKGIVVVDANSGEVLWKRRDADTAELMPATLAVATNHVFLQNTRQVICLDAGTGEECWRADRPVYTTRLSWAAPTLVVSEGVVLSADGSTGGLPAEARRGEDRVEWILSDQDIRKHPPGDLVAFDAKTGKRLWSGDALQGFNCPGDVFVIDGLVWAGALVGTGQHTLDVALDPRTGKVVRRRPTGGPPVGGHTRCYRNKATERFLVLGGIGVEFVEVDGPNWTSDTWVRGTCQYGVMPCNGLLYVPPDSCACRPNVRLHGFTAMAAGRSKNQMPGTKVEVRRVRDEGRLEKGGAYAKASLRPSSSSLRPSSSWPTYRCDGRRSGWTKEPLPDGLTLAWESTIGGRLSAPTVADGKVYVSRVDTNTVCALNAESGGECWARTVGGAVDSPPTIADGRVIFGSRDGWVYCLSAADGKLAWRFLAAPDERCLVAHERVESPWPVHGSVLVREGLVWFAAGRSPYLDGGLRLYALDLATGEVRVNRRLDGRDDQTWTATFRQPRFRDPPGTMPDILSTLGDRLFMGPTCFDPAGNVVVPSQAHIFSATGFLDDTWWHRTYWQYGTWMRGGFGGWPQAAQRAPAGRLLVMNEESIFGFGRSKYDPGNPKAVHAGHVGVIKDGYQDIGHIDHSQNPMRLFATVKPDPATPQRRGAGPLQYRWQTSVPLLVRAMLLADRSLVIAGPKERPDNQALADLRQPQPSLLLTVSAEDGNKLSSLELSSDPVLDGMAAAGGKLYLAATDGKLRCFAEVK